MTRQQDAVREQGGGASVQTPGQPSAGQAVRLDYLDGRSAQPASIVTPVAIVGILFALLAVYTVAVVYYENYHWELPRASGGGID